MNNLLVLTHTILFQAACEGNVNAFQSSAADESEHFEGNSIENYNE